MPVELVERDEEPLALLDQGRDPPLHRVDVLEREDARRSAWRRRGGTAARPSRARRRPTAGATRSRAGARRATTPSSRCGSPPARASSSTRLDRRRRRELAVGLVDDHEPGRGVEDRLDRRRRLDGARRVVRAAEEHDLGLLALDDRDRVVGDRSTKSSRRGAVTTSVPVMRAMWLCSAYVGSNTSARRPGPAVGEQERLEHLVGAVGGEDPRRPAGRVGAPIARAQLGRGAVRVPVQRRVARARRATRRRTPAAAGTGSRWC